MEVPQLQVFDRGLCARAARWISGLLLEPFSGSPSCGGYASVLEASWTISQYFPSWSFLSTFWFDSGYLFFISLWMALEEFHIVPRGLVDSDPEFVASLSLWGHARCQQRQWHAFYWFCWSWCTSRCVPDDCRQVPEMEYLWRHATDH